MPKRKGPRKTSGQARQRRRQRNPGLPDPKTIVSERTVVSPKGQRFRIITTTDKDAYDPNGNGKDRDGNDK